MIVGVVNEYLEATIQLTVHGPNRKQKTITAVIDTGYNGFLMLPPGIVADLGLEWESQTDATLADGRTTRFEVYKAIVLWNRQRKWVDVDESDGTPLLGTYLITVM